MAHTLLSAKSRTRDITLTVQVWREDGAYVAYAPELDISSCGDSLRQSKARLREATALFLEEAARQGTLESILAEAGFQKRGNSYRARRILAKEKIRLAETGVGFAGRSPRGEAHVTYAGVYPERSRGELSRSSGHCPLVAELMLASNFRLSTCSTFDSEPSGCALLRK
jgi:predicted RNase H-like HicB family nuclease